MLADEIFLLYECKESRRGIPALWMQGTYKETFQFCGCKERIKRHSSSKGIKNIKRHSSSKGTKNIKKNSSSKGIHIEHEETFQL